MTLGLMYNNVMLCATYRPFMLSAVMLNVVLLSDVAPGGCHLEDRIFVFLIAFSMKNGN